MSFCFYWPFGNQSEKLRIKNKPFSLYKKNMQEKENIDVAKLILPNGILDYFILKDLIQTDKFIHLHLEEKNLPPLEYKNEKLTSKGFLDEIKVQDFPIRGKEVYLLIKRRRWYNTSTGSYVCRNWELVANGTRMTNDFAFFLKIISRHKTS